MTQHSKNLVALTTALEERGGSMSKAKKAEVKKGEWGGGDWC